MAKVEVQKEVVAPTNYECPPLDLLNDLAKRAGAPVDSQVSFLYDNDYSVKFTWLEQV